MSLYYYNPATVNLKFLTKGALKWNKIYNWINRAVFLHDRSNTYQLPIMSETYDRCILPSLSYTNKSYEQCCDERAKQLYDLSVSFNKPIGVMWSGGIDSTNILVSFMRNYSIAELKSRMKIILSEYSCRENPKFYAKYILPNFEFVNSEYTPWLADGSMILVSGEFNDQLFGSDTIKGLIAYSSVEEVNSKLNKELLLNYMTYRTKDKEVSSMLFDMVTTTAENNGVMLEKTTDFLWWYNFCFKWQGVHFRIHTLFANTITPEWERQYLHHFYGTTNFQNWSVSNPDVRYITNWKNYKMKAKEMIFEFDSDEDYFRNKIKMPSLAIVFHQRNVCEAIDNQFNMLRTIDPHEYRNSDFKFPA